MLDQHMPPASKTAKTTQIATPPARRCVVSTPRRSSFVLLLLQSSCIYLPKMVAQQKGMEVTCRSGMPNESGAVNGRALRDLTGR
jgi:hypothetical protein